jgi:hypothetical protein
MGKVDRSYVHSHVEESKTTHADVPEEYWVVSKRFGSWSTKPVDQASLTTLEAGATCLGQLALVM